MSKYSNTKIQNPGECEQYWRIYRNGSNWYQSGRCILIGGKSTNQKTIMKPEKVSFAHREACDLIVVGSSQNHRGNFDSKFARVRSKLNWNKHLMIRFWLFKAELLMKSPFKRRKLAIILNLYQFIRSACSKFNLTVHLQNGWATFDIKSPDLRFCFKLCGVTFMDSSTCVSIVQWFWWTFRRPIHSSRIWFISFVWLAHLTFSTVMMVK